MQHILHALHRRAGDVHVREVALEEVDLRQVCEIVALARDQAVDHADAVAATYEGFGTVGADEAGTTGHEILGHERAASARTLPRQRIVVLLGKAGSRSAG
jgi:hypothetical protein